MMQGDAPGVIDEIQGRLPPFLKWCLMGVGAAAGWYYARTDASPIPLSYIIGGGATGFFLPGCLFAGLRLLKGLAIAGAVLVVLNYALLIPFGYGDYVPGWISAGRSIAQRLNPAPLVRRWGKDVEIASPRGR